MRNKKVSTLLLIISLIFFLELMAQEVDDAIDNPLILEGIKLFRQGKLDEAQSVLERALAQNQNDADACNALAIVLSQKNELNKALEYFDKAISLKKGNFKAIYNKLNVLIRLERHEDGIALLRSVTQEYPDHINGWVNLGAILMQKGETDEAVECFDKAIALDPNDFDARFKKGQVLLLQKKYEEAHSLFKKALELSPEFDPARRGMNIAEDIIRKKKEGYIRLRQILVMNRSTAEQARTELENGTDFIEVCLKYSVDPSAKSGGNLGFLQKGMLVKAIDDVVFSLKIGQISEIIRTGRGFHIFKREE